MIGFHKLAVGLIISLSCIASDIAATEKTQCEVWTVQASNDGTGIAPALHKFAHLFKKKPFAAYNSFKLVEKQVVNLTLQTPKSLKLPDNIGGSLRLNGQVGSQLDLTLTLTRSPKSPITIRGYASPGSPLIAAGLSSRNGVWVFGVVCSDKKRDIVTF